MVLLSTPGCSRSRWCRQSKGRSLGYLRVGHAPCLGLSLGQAIRRGHTSHTQGPPCSAHAHARLSGCPASSHSDAHLASPPRRRPYAPPLWDREPACDSRVRGVRSAATERACACTPPASAAAATCLSAEEGLSSVRVHRAVMEGCHAPRQQHLAASSVRSPIRLGPSALQGFGLVQQSTGRCSSP